MPIFMALSIVAVVGFGLIYFTFGKAALNEGEGDGAAAAPTPPPAAVQTQSKPTHTQRLANLSGGQDLSRHFHGTVSWPQRFLHQAPNVVLYVICF